MSMLHVLTGIAGSGTLKVVGCDRLYSAYVLYDSILSNWITQHI